MVMECSAIESRKADDPTKGMVYNELCYMVFVLSAILTAVSNMLDRDVITADSWTFVANRAEAHA